MKAPLLQGLDLGLGFRILGIGFAVWGYGLKVWGSGFWFRVGVWGLGSI